MDLRFRNWMATIAMTTLAILAGCEKEAPVAAAPPPAQVSTVTIQPQRVVLATELPGRTSPGRRSGR